jgi:recombination protein RecA
MSEELDKLLKDIRKEWEDDAIVLTGAGFDGIKPEAISTGSLAVDLATGIGGIPRGRVTELFGIESTGKSTLCNYIIANAQRKGIHCGYIDTEQSGDPDYMELCGVDYDSLWFSQPDTLDSALSLSERWIDSGLFGCIVFDSVVGLSTATEKEKEIGERSVSSISGLLTQYFKKNMYGIRANNVAMIFTNQARDVIGSYVPMVGTSGGHALKHYASVRIQTKKKEDIKVNGEVVGIDCIANFKKNKVGGRPGSEPHYSIYYGKGIVKGAEVYNMAIEYGVLIPRGAYTFYNGENIGQGKEKTIAMLSENQELTDKIEKEVLAQVLGDK